MSRAELDKLIEERLLWFKSEAAKHRRLHRALWAATTAISLGVAFATTFKFVVWGPVDSVDLAKALGIVLPAVTAYVVLRSPERLWVFETVTRNRLYRLKERLALAAEDTTDDAKSREEYFQIMNDATDRWASIKGGQ